MLSVKIDPDCFDNTKTNYNAGFADMQSQGKGAWIRINIEIPSSLIDFEQVFPRLTEREREMGFTAHAFHVMMNPRLLDETALAYAGTGLQGAVMFSLAHYVQRGLVQVTKVEDGVVWTAQNIRDYAANGHI